MVRALLAGSKTQTRRVVKFGATGNVHRAGRNWHVNDPDAVVACPYGLVGDRLWVKETWAAAASADHLPPSLLSSVKSIRGVSDLWYPGNGDAPTDTGLLKGKTRVSIHMPRWGSRILLDVTEVRAERLQAISGADAIAEGLRWRPVVEAWTAGGDDWPTFTDPRRAYHGLWNSINGAGSWEANPWVWVVAFKRAGAIA